MRKVKNQKSINNKRTKEEDSEIEHAKKRQNADNSRDSPNKSPDSIIEDKSSENHTSNSSDDQPEDEDDMNSTPNASKSNQKNSPTIRSRASWQQRILLERVFQNNQYPNQELRNQLAQQLGMSTRKVQIWFQNRRTKSKTVQHEEQHQIHLLSKGVDSRDINLKQVSTGNTLLLLATVLDHHSVQNLLNKGADCNIANHQGWTPLYAAVVNGHKHLVEIFLSKRFNCNVNTREHQNGQSPLHLACLRGLEAISWVILSKGMNTDPNIRDFENRTPLHHASICGYTEIVRQLIIRKADPNVTSTEGFTPLHAATLSGHREIVEMLIKAGANINTPDVYGYTPLAFAVREQREEIVEILLYRGANVVAVTNEGLTPLHIACCRQSFQNLKLLIECGAPLECTSIHGFTPLQLAHLHQNHVFIDYLMQRLALRVTSFSPLQLM